MEEQITLIEALTKSGGVPFTVRCVKAGGEFREGWLLQVDRVSTREQGQHKGQVQYDFTVDGTRHRGWRHTSDARFALVAVAPKTALPADIEELIGSDDDENFGCYTPQVRELALKILAKVASPRA